MDRAKGSWGTRRTEAKEEAARGSSNALSLTEDGGTEAQRVAQTGQARDRAGLGSGGRKPLSRLPAQTHPTWRPAERIGKVPFKARGKHVWPLRQRPGLLWREDE